MLRRARRIRRPAHCSASQQKLSNGANVAGCSTLVAQYTWINVRTIKVRATGQARSARGEPPLANLVPLIIDRQILVDGTLAHCVDPVQPRIALVAGLEARRNVGGQRELKTLRKVHATLVLHEDRCAVIGAKRHADVHRSRPVGAEEHTVTGRSELRERGGELRDRQPLRAGELRERRQPGQRLAAVSGVGHDAVVCAAGAGAEGAGAVAAEHLGEVQPLSSIRSPSGPPRSSQVWLKWCRNRCG